MAKEFERSQSQDTHTHTHTTFEISLENKHEIDHWLTKYPADQRRSAIVKALLLVQEQNNNFLSEDAMNAAADYLKIPRVEAYEVATFYDMYHLRPIGKHKINLCTNISCMLRGSDELLAHLKNRLGITPGETTADGKITLIEVECMAACGGAPMCQIDDKHYHENLTCQKLDVLIDALEEK
jgi:NADH-quinone oxidoreductase subunit E